jgi:hypothetical protein
MWRLLVSAGDLREPVNAPPLEEWLTERLRKFTEEFFAKGDKESDDRMLNGPGVGLPLGILKEDIEPN